MRRFLYNIFAGLIFFVPIISIAQPAANFTSSVTSGCAPLIVQFTDISTGGPTGWSWTFTAPNIDTLYANSQNPAINFTTPGLYTVKLVATNASGSNTKTLVGYIHVVTQPVISFIADDTILSCSPLTVHFTNNSTTTGSGRYYTWDFGDGDTTQQHKKNPVHTFHYTFPGLYNITLFETDTIGCSANLTKNEYIKLDSLPDADFSVSNMSCHAPDTAQFTNLTTGGAVSYFWKFGDGGNSTAVNPVHVYTTSGTFTDTLIATNALGCKDTIRKIANIVVANVQAQFTYNPEACVGAFVGFTQTTIPATGIKTWDFHDGGPQQIFSGFAGHVFNTAGIFPITLIFNANGCIDSITHDLTVNAGPNVSFTASGSFNCAPPFIVNFTNGTTGTGVLSYKWHFGDGDSSIAQNPSHTYTAVGIYTDTLTVTDGNGCTNTLVMPDLIDVGPPTGNIFVTPDSVCLPGIISYSTSLSTGVGYVVDSIKFGDNTPYSTSASGVHTYTVPGTYNIVGTFTTLDGCVITASQQVFVSNTFPNASPTVFNSTPCSANGDTFYANCNNCTSYLWNFPNQATSTLANPYYAYGGLGNVNVSLIASVYGCLDTYAISYTVIPPVANYGVTNPQCSDRLTFAFLNSSLGSNLVSVWDFGDGSGPDTTSAIIVNHTFPVGNHYTVILTVYSSSGCASVKSKVVFAGDPQASFNVSDSAVCKGGTVDFHDPVIPFGGGNYFSYFWLFGDGDSSSIRNPSHIYDTTGFFTSTVVFVSVYGCTDTLSRVISVGGPVAGFTFTAATGCAPFNITFQDQSTSLTGASIVARKWVFGDGTFNDGNSSNITHSYGPGICSVVLLDTDAAGCASSDTMLNIISVSRPHAYFYSPDTLACPLLPIVFFDTTTNVTYSWHFGDGGIAALQSPQHIYTASGNYSDTLIVTNSVGCSDTMIRSNYIHIQSLSVGFNLSDTAASCPPLFVSMTNTSLPSLTGNLSYTWTFGNGNFSLLTNPSTVYNNVGVFPVTLIATNAIGCTDSITKTVAVHGPSGVLAYSPINGCMPLTVTFDILQSQNTTLWYWGPDATASTTGVPHFVYTYTLSGTYVPEVILSNGSCQVKIVGTDTIKVDHLDGDFTYTPASLCNSGIMSFFDTALYSLSDINTRSWNFGDPSSGTNNTSNLHNPTHFFGSIGNYTVKLIITNLQGCSDTVIKVIHVNPPPRIRVDSNQLVCLGHLVHLSVTDSANAATSYTWSPPDGLSATTGASVNASPTVATTYTVVAHTPGGCTDTGTVTLLINSITVDGGPNQEICQGQIATLAGTGAGTGGTYKWTPNIQLSCDTCATTLAGPPGPTSGIGISTITYILTGTSAQGCKDTAHVIVVVHAPPSVDFVSNQIEVCSGDSVRLIGQGAGAGGSYSWAPTSTVSSPTGDTVYVTPVFTTTYSVTGSTILGCSDSSFSTINVAPGATLVFAGNTDICQGTDSITLSVSGAATNNYLWQPASAVACDSCGTTLAHLTSTTTFTVSGLNASTGCRGIDSVTITVHPPPVVVVSDQIVCSGQSVQLFASGANTYVWFPATALSCANCAAPFTSTDSNIIYSIAGTDTYGCRDTASMNVTVIYRAPETISPGDTICPGQSVQLFVTGGSSYSWQPSTGLNNATLDSPISTPAVTTTYTVSVFQQQCFTDTQYVTIVVGAPPVVSLTPSQNIISGDSILLSADSVVAGSTYLWSPATGLSCINCPNPTARPVATTTYSVTVTSDNGCISSGQTTISVYCDQIQVFIPNTFTPNGDGHNDRFYASGKGIQSINSFKIYDRWGQKVFDVENIPANDPEFGWDGKYKGKALEADVYVYEIKAHCETGAPLYYKGDISIVK